VQDAEASGFTLVSDAACEEGFLGNRYAEDDDFSVIVVYDANGYIAGIQKAVSISQVVSMKMLIDIIGTFLVLPRSCCRR
jgi:hypothetical protein